MKKTGYVLCAAVVVLLSVEAAMGQDDTSGSLSNNRNTTNSLAGFNDESDLFLGRPSVGRPSVATPAPAAVVPSTAAVAPVHAPPKPVFGSLPTPTPETEQTTTTVKPKGSRNGFGLADQ